MKTSVRRWLLLRRQSIIGLMLFIVLALTHIELTAQDSLLNPIFSAFEGIVYKIPIKRLPLGYGQDILKLPIIDTLHWERIDFPDNDVSVPFPGVNMTQGFGIIFTGTVQIPKSAYYQFATNSDDGTIFWIDGQKIVDNDKHHQMRLRVDTVALSAGTYPVKLWYYQAYPTRYGVQLDGRFYRNLLPEEALPEPAATNQYKIVLDETQLLFEHNSSVLLPSAKATLVQLAASLLDQPIRRIIITGHTDNVGTETYNQQLSLARAQSVKTALAKQLTAKKMVFLVRGKGESEPIASNATAAGQAKNRRVVIELE